MTSPAARLSKLPEAPSRERTVLSRVSSAVGPGLLLSLMAAALAADWAIPLDRFAMKIATAAMTALALVWVPIVLRTERVLSAVADEGLSRLRSRVYHAAVILLMAGLLAGKWLVLIHAQADPPAFVAASQSYALSIFFVYALGLMGRGLRFARFAAFVSDHPARLMAISFGGAGILGGLLLGMPVCVNHVAHVSLVDNLFIAFSAVCVTGLAVNNVAESYSLVGQGVICVLIQIGGLGIMVLSAAFAVLAGQRMRVKSSVVLAEIIDTSSLSSLKRAVVSILTFTLVLEGIGAWLLYLRFRGIEGIDMLAATGKPVAGPGSALWAALFHAVSAFCNAGFSNMRDGLTPFASDPLVCLTVTVLIVLGGVGFPVLQELAKLVAYRLRRQRPPVACLNTRVALRTTALLLGSLAVPYLLIEWTHAFAGLGYFDRVIAAVFQSASARTAGFNVVDIGAMRPAALVLTCAFMFIGACPGSTGGGIKTTTLAVLFAALRSELTGRAPRLLDRAVPEPVIRKAIGVAFLGLTMVLMGFIVLLLLEPYEPLSIAFETVSALSTTGLSMGITPKLSVAGKLVVTMMMLIGRIGPMTLAMALASRSHRSPVALPEERLMIG